MNYIDQSLPRARHWALPGMTASVLLVWAFSFDVNTVFTISLFACGCVAGGWSLVNLWHHVRWVVTQMKVEEMEARFKLSENQMAETIQKMNPDQLKALRMFGGQVLEVIPTGNDVPVEKIYGINVYLQFAWYMLMNSNDSYVKPIRDFFKDTYHFDYLGDGGVDDITQARQFTAWLVRYGYAAHHLSNRSARWTSPNARKNAMRRLGLDEDSYAREYAELS